ncbi:PREDICTED: BTB/POZ domain-containing protein 17 [Papilio polytes]|uniref:BTB/POZ domain-containing protein 17 n=1 Tax=Papilio polytes TaxID=76194 RepID=UPI00067636D0|nr:PREDICTED: BTB/POZ domain-containing protein 17 [Papilio polytes]
MSSQSRDLASCSSISENNDENINNNDDLEVDNSRCVLLKIATMYAEQLMSDLILDVGGVAYPVHRLILCASSEVFQVMLMNREWSECKKTRIVLQENPVAASVFPQFLKYFYTGQIKISHQTVLPVLSLADKYNVSDLMTLCLEYMGQHVAQAAQRGQLIAWMQYTMACGHNKVAKACQNFFKWNLEWSWQDSELDELEGETLAQLLQQNDLVVHNEMSVYKLVQVVILPLTDYCYVSPAEVAGADRLKP